MKGIALKDIVLENNLVKNNLKIAMIAHKNVVDYC
jgi:hypothetical protein